MELDKHQLAPKLLEDLGIPMIPHNYRAAVAAIEAVQHELSKTGKITPRAAYDYLLGQAQESWQADVPVNYFWLTNGTFWPNNRPRNWKKAY